MALVCDIKSTPSTDNPSSEKPPEDVEDGEITDDDEEPSPPEPTPIEPPLMPLPATAGAHPTVPVIKKSQGNTSDSDSHGVPARDRSPRERSSERERFSDDKERDKKGRERRVKEKGRGEKGGHKHMTEAERSILHLRKREKIMREREKWEKQGRKEPDPMVKYQFVDDDFAKTIEKTLATILNKKEKEAGMSGGEEPPQAKEETKRGKKRKKEERDKERAKGKHRRVIDSPRSEIDENEMLNIRSGSPGAEMRLHPQGGPPFGPHMDHRRSRSLSRSEESFHSEYSSDEREERSRRKSAKNRRKKENRDRRRDREQRRSNRDEQAKLPLQDSQGVCVFYMQGKCQKNDCPYSHEVSPPMKLELCKFYLMDCCAKGENCSYMHSEFPCKFYHTGLKCAAGDDCKFAHGRALSEGLKQILFKHIETAPRDILQGFPRLSRDEALNLINQSQKKLAEQYNSDPNTSSSSTYNTPLSSQNFGPPTSSSSGPVIYREEIGDYGGSQHELGDREKEPSKGGIPSLFDINVPVPRELAQGLDFEVKMPKSERNRNKQSRWQKDQDGSMSGGFPMKNFSYGTDQDMRINSNGDIDMRTLPSIPTTTTSNLSLNTDTPGSSLDQRDGYSKDVDIRSTNVLPFTKDVDIRHAPLARYAPPTKDVDIRQQIPKVFEEKAQSQTDTEDELHIATEEDQKQSSTKTAAADNFELPQATRDLLARITANQKDNTVDSQNTIQSQSTASQSSNYDVDVQNINWYSDDDDDDDNRLTIKVEDEDAGKRERNDSIDSSSSALDKDGADQSSQSPNSSFLSPPQFNTKTADIVGKLGDLSKIDISAEVTKLLTSMSQGKNLPSADNTVNVPSSSPSSKAEGGFSPRTAALQDPRMARLDPRTNQVTSSQEQHASRQDPRQDPRLSDPRQRPRQGSIDNQEKSKKPEKMSIYEQGGLDMKKAALEIDSEEYKGSLRPDVDLRNMALPFKGMQNYTPATEIDASVNSHLPMPWRVAIVEIPRPDYTGLKLSINDAEKTGDPRLRKIFRLSVDEKDSPASPKASPKQNAGTRVDPRLRKLEEKSLESQQAQQLSYSQQLNMLQSSQFYQSLTSNQKLLLNQELARCDQSGGGGMSDPVLNNLLSNLNLLPQPITNQPPSLGTSPHGGDVLSILANISKINPLLPNQPLLGQQGLLGAAPGIPHIPSSVAQGIPPDYPINFDPRNGGLLGNAPPGNYGQFGGGMEQQFGGYNDDFYGGYDDPVNMGPQGGNMGPQGGNFRPGRGYNNRDGRRRGNRDGFRGGRGNRNFKRGGGRDNRGDRGDRIDRDRDRDGGRGNRGHSPS